MRTMCKPRSWMDAFGGGLDASRRVHRSRMWRCTTRVRQFQSESIIYSRWRNRLPPKHTLALLRSLPFDSGPLRHALPSTVKHSQGSDGQVRACLYSTS
jgi:hypothetical protein